ncbi:hypothetical protein SeMB42_g05954 [Synchytrium endobioticum]|uniref:Uncharacterized protein n=1 Tax=Synchytrium endobioticum TaxID=286115 RepID=A0A507CN37_9FUNG|nr:hypothetical protein SeMB42_g05954 [Synchytrium endobioticum]
MISPITRGESQTPLQYILCWVAPTQTVSSKHGTVARAPINPPAGTAAAGIVINSARATCCESLKACWLDWVGRWCLEGQTTS